MYSLLFLAALPGQLMASPTFSEDRQWAALEATVRVLHPGTALYGASIGSGVVVGRDGNKVYVLTANHNMPPGPDVKTAELRFFTRKSYPEPSVVIDHARIAARMPEADLAVIEAVLKDPHPGLLEICPKDRLAAVNFFGPMNRAPIPVLAIGTEVGTRAPTAWDDSVILAGKVKPESDARFYEAKRATVEGRSGGPLMDKRGFLIGICSGTAKGKGYYLFVDDIHKALGRNGYDFLLQKQKPAAGASKK